MRAIKERLMKWSTHLAQFLKHRLFDAALLKINSRAVNHLVNDCLVDVSNGLVRHVAQ
jgi:hypothetical protein